MLNISYSWLWEFFVFGLGFDDIADEPVEIPQILSPLVLIANIIVPPELLHNDTMSYNLEIVAGIGRHPTDGCT